MGSYRQSPRRILRLIVPVGIFLIAQGALLTGALGQDEAVIKQLPQLRAIDLGYPEGQILSYRKGRGSTEIYMRGTALAPRARIKLKVESRPGFLELDINRGDINRLGLAREHGKDFLTYVMWAVSISGQAANLGEITFSGRSPISINVTTTYQTFWLMVTAEPDYAVAEPSSRVVLYSVKQEVVKDRPEKKALPVKGDMFYYTRYGGYDTSPQVESDAPIDLQQARKAVDLASRAGVLAVEPPVGVEEPLEVGRTRSTLALARTFLADAERHYSEKPKGRDVVQFARTAAQIAENARALAMGAVGGGLIRALESELARERAQQGGPTETSAPRIEYIASKPVVWMGFLGWGLAFLLLLRRNPA